MRSRRWPGGEERNNAAVNIFRATRAAHPGFFLYGWARIPCRRRKDHVDGRDERSGNDPVWRISLWSRWGRGLCDAADGPGSRWSAGLGAVALGSQPVRQGLSAKEECGAAAYLRRARQNDVTPR